ncbi:13491_t:CDS:1, partial [Gigaspora margarita]
SNVIISRILSELWKNEPNEVRHYWQNLANKIKIEQMLASPEYCYPNKIKNSKRNRKLKATDSNQFQNVLSDIQTYDILYPFPSEYIFTMDPTNFPWFYDHFENTNPTVLPSIFPKDDLYSIINKHNENAQQSLTEATTSITYPYDNKISPNTHNENAQQSLTEANTSITYPYYNNISPY